MCDFGNTISDAIFLTDCCGLNPLNAELNPICCLLALLAHHFLHVSRVRVKSLTLRLLMLYIYVYIWSTYSWCFQITHNDTAQLVGLLWTSDQLACWDLGFKSHRGHGYLSVVSVVPCQVEVSATNWSLVQRSPTDCTASLCVI